MNLTYASPIKYDIVPVPEHDSIVAFEFKLKKSKKRIKTNVCLNISYKDQFIIGRVFLASSDTQSIYTSTDDQIHTLKFKTPEFKDHIQSYIYITMEPIDFYDKIEIEDMKITDVTPIRPPLQPAQYIQSIQQPIHQEQQPLHMLQVALPQQQPIRQPPTLQTTPPQSQQVRPPHQSTVMINTQANTTCSPPQTILTRVAPSSDTIKEQRISKVMFASTRNIKCGIALYTEDLFYMLNKMYPNSFAINPVNDGKLTDNMTGELIHIQHEYSILPNPLDIKGKVIITWHTIPMDIYRTLRIFESKLDIVAHIIPCDAALQYMHTEKDVFVVSLGSTIMPPINKQDARKLLGIDIDKPIGFVFGFQSPAKNYIRLARAAKNAGIYLIISGSLHNSGYDSGIKDEENVNILSRFLTDMEINLYSLASDILLFDYSEQAHFSSSSALHRTIGAGRPVVCANIRHFSDIKGVPKFDNQKELENCIKYALEHQEFLGKLSLDFARETSWENVAKKHIDIYRKYIDI